MVCEGETYFIQFITWFNHVVNGSHFEVQGLYRFVFPKAFSGMSCFMFKMVSVYLKNIWDFEVIFEEWGCGLGF